MTTRLLILSLFTLALSGRGGEPGYARGSLFIVGGGGQTLSLIHI